MHLQLKIGSTPIIVTYVTTRLAIEVTHRITMFVVTKLVGLDIRRIEVANVRLEWTIILLMLVVYLFSKLAQIKSYKVV